MAGKDPEFLKRLMATFAEEAKEHMQALSSRLLALEQGLAGAEEAACIEQLFREAHSLKGAARAVDRRDIELLCQRMESIFAAMKRRELSVSGDIFDALHGTVKEIERRVAAPELEHSSKGREQLRAITGLLERILSGREPSPPPPQRPVEEQILSEETISPAPAPTETIRVSVEKLDALVLEAEELIGLKHAADQHHQDLLELRGMVQEWEEVLGSHGADAEPSSGMQTGNRDLLVALERRLDRSIRNSDQRRRSAVFAIGQLQSDTRRLVMVPFSSLLEGFPLMVRELARSQGKEIALEIAGGDVEIDRRILEEMKDPLMHLVRNSIGHGIEPPEVREERKKPRRGRIALSISPVEGDRVEVVVEDDGAGIDLPGVLSAAVRSGILSEEEVAALGRQEALSLVFQSGISTQPRETELSGRGLGLAIVQEKVEDLGGTLWVESAAGAGTRVYLQLPLTRATFRGVLVQSGGQTFGVPSFSIERVLRLRGDPVIRMENRETISYDGRILPVIPLATLLELPAEPQPADLRTARTLLIVVAGGQRIALAVDAVLGAQEFLVKNLGHQLSRVRNVAGAAILGSGVPLPVLHAPDLVRSALRSEGQGRVAIEHPVPVPKRYRILVVEDSITARSLLRNILEAAGYSVKTAVDGFDAWMALKTERFHLVVSDIDMPRMNGFELVRRIRGDEALADLPVVLVTALDSREDRERGIDAGANAYIVKSAFDQTDLLEAVARLL